MLRKASKLSRPGKVKQKEFKPKNNLPHLENYSVDLPQSYCMAREFNLDF